MAYQVKMWPNENGLLLTGRGLRLGLALCLVPLLPLACTTLGHSGSSAAPAQDEAEQLAGSGETQRTPAAAATDLADVADDRSSATKASNFQLLDVPGLGSFYLPSATVRDLRSARAKARLRLKDHPEDPWALRTLAVYEMAIGNAFGAKTYLEIARNRGLGFEPESSLVMGLALLALGHDDRAVAEFERAEATNEGYALSHLNQGLYALNRGSASQAAQHFSSAALRDGRNVVARLHLGQAYFLMRMHTQALKQFDEVISVAPSNTIAHFNRGVVLHRGLREFERARDAFEVVLQSAQTAETLRRKTLGALRNLDRDAQGRDNIATIGSF